jgi:hypothetical protein
MFHTGSASAGHASIRDVVRYDVPVQLSAFVVAGVWLLAGFICLLEWQRARQTDFQSDALVLLAVSGLAWLILAAWRTQALNRILDRGRPVVGTVELSIKSGNWLRILVSFELNGIQSEKSFALPPVGAANRISQGDRITLAVDPAAPMQAVLTEVLFRTLPDSHPTQETDVDEAEERGPRHPIEFMFDNMFHRTSAGTLVFRPWSRGSRGYVLKSEDQMPRLRKATSTCWNTALIAGIAGMAYGGHGIAIPECGCPGLLRWIGFSLLGALLPMLAFAIWLRVALRGLARYDGPPTPLPDHVILMARANRGEMRFAAVATALLGLITLAAGHYTDTSGCLPTVLALSCFAGGLAFGYSGWAQRKS